MNMDERLVQIEEEKLNMKLREREEEEEREIGTCSWKETEIKRLGACGVCRNKRRRNWLDYPPLPATDSHRFFLFIINIFIYSILSFCLL